MARPVMPVRHPQPTWRIDDGKSGPFPALPLQTRGLALHWRSDSQTERRVPCPRYTTCQFAHIVSMREALRVWQSFYCDGMYKRCERFKLAEAGSDVPSRLLPNGRLQEDQPLRAGTSPRPAR